MKFLVATVACCLVWDRLIRERWNNYHRHLLWQRTGGAIAFVISHLNGYYQGVWVCICTQISSLCQVCVCVCVGCWVKPLIEKQATVATCLTVSPSICLEQHGASVRKGGRGSEAGGSDGEPASLHLCFLSLSLFSLFGRQRWSWKRPFLSLSLSPHLLRHPSQCEFFLSSIICESAPGHITTRRALLWV